MPSSTHESEEWITVMNFRKLSQLTLVAILASLVLVLLDSVLPASGTPQIIVGKVDRTCCDAELPPAAGSVSTVYTAPEKELQANSNPYLR